MLNKKTLILIGCFVTFFPLLSFGFDCSKPDFGATLQELNKDGYFVKYMEKGGVSYYNYTGPCRFQIHSTDNPAIAFAFVDDQLYARIIRTSDYPGKSHGGHEAISELMHTTDIKEKQEGDLIIYQWVNEKEKTKYKVKFNTKTGDHKSAWYYEPFREKLKAKSQVLDPVGEIE